MALPDNRIFETASGKCPALLVLKVFLPVKPKKESHGDQEK
jgi:hypothetical protein